MILRLEMILSVVYYERKNIIYIKKFKTYYLFNNIFHNIEFLLTSAYQFSENYWVFMNHDLFFPQKYSLQLYSFQF